MTVSAEIEAEIRRLHFAEHWPVGTVASQLGLHADVVRRVVGLLDRRRPSALPRPLLVEPFQDFIDDTLKTYPKLRATRLFDMVRCRGYQGSVRTLREYVATVRPQPQKEVFLRLNPLVGEQAQADWMKAGEISVPGGKRDLWLFVMVLAWSRAMWGEFVLDLTVHSLLRSLARASRFFGGCCRQWLFDNPKIVVQQRHGDAVRFHPLALDLGSRFNVQLRLCTPGKANEKGRVERANRYLRERFLAARTITSVEQGNRELLTFIEDVAHARPHPIWPQRTVADCLAEERRSLLPLPVPLPGTDVVLPVSAGKTAFVRFDRNDYSVPPEYAHRTLTLVADDQTIRVLDGEALVAQHVRGWGKHQTIELLEHRRALVELKRAAQDTKGRDLLRSVAPRIDELFERWVEAGRNVGYMTARSLQLLELYGHGLFAEAVVEILTRGTSDVGALAQICEQRRKSHAQPVPISISLGHHVPDRDVVHHDLESYDARR